MDRPLSRSPLVIIAKTNHRDHEAWPIHGGDVSVREDSVGLIGFRWAWETSPLFIVPRQKNLMSLPSLCSSPSSLALVAIAKAIDTISLALYRYRHQYAEPPL